MKKIKKVTLSNFQAHKYKEFTFIDGLNVIYGDNNRGKSALQRAIYWNFTNKPLGEWMRPKLNNKLLNSSCIVEFNDGFVSHRIRGEENMYIINGQEFRELGSEVPSLLSDYLGDIVLNLGRQKFYPNFLLPDDSVFMVRESSITKGSLVNYFTGFTLIENIKRGISKDIKENKAALKGKKASLKIVKDELLKYENLDYYDKANKKLQNNFCEIEKIKFKLKKILDYCKFYHKIEKETEILKSFLKQMLILQKQHDNLNLLRDKHATLSVKCNKYLQLTNSFKELCLSTVNLDTLNSISKKVLKVEEDKKRIMDISNIIDTIIRIENKIGEDTANLKEVIKEKNKIPNVCDQCGQVIN